MKDINKIRQTTKDVVQLEKLENLIEGFIDSKIEEASKNGYWFVHINLMEWSEGKADLQVTKGIVEVIADEYDNEGYEIKTTLVSDLHIVWKQDDNRRNKK